MGQQHKRSARVPMTDERRAEREKESLWIVGVCVILGIALIAVPLWMAVTDWLAGGAS